MNKPINNKNLIKDEKIGPNSKLIPAFKLKPEGNVDEGIQINPNLADQIANPTAKKDIGTQFTFEDSKLLRVIIK